MQDSDNSSLNIDDDTHWLAIVVNPEVVRTY